MVLNEPLKINMIVGIGNPLLDIISHVDENFLSKYNLKSDDAILASPEHMPIYDELIKRDDVMFAPGGAVQNSLKIFQWIIGKPNLTTFMGAIGNDKYGQIMKHKMESFGVNTIYDYKDDHSTGTCAVLVDKDKRSLCAHLGAAQKFSKAHYLQHLKIIHQAQYFYISGYFLASCPQTMLRVAQHAHQTGKVFMMNLSATYLCQLFKEEMLSVFPYIDILFANQSEICALAKELDFPQDDIVEMGKAISNMPKINNNQRIIVITQDANPTILIADGQVRHFSVIPIKQCDIVDTNGAGDAFVGGFLSQYLQSCEWERCIEFGHKAAYIIIKRHGCTFPEDLTFDKAFELYHGTQDHSSI